MDRLRQDQDQPLKNHARRGRGETHIRVFEIRYGPFNQQVYCLATKKSQY